MVFKTNYKDQIPEGNKLLYQIIDDKTGGILNNNVHIKRANKNTQEGDVFGATQLNEIGSFLNKTSSIIEGVELPSTVTDFKQITTPSRYIIRNKDIGQPGEKYGYLDVWKYDTNEYVMEYYDVAAMDKYACKVENKVITDDWHLKEGYIDLWSGTANAGDTITLKRKINMINFLEIRFSTGTPQERIVIPINGESYTYVGSIIAFNVANSAHYIKSISVAVNNNTLYVGYTSERSITTGGNGAPSSFSIVQVRGI